MQAPLAQIKQKRQCERDTYSEDGYERQPAKRAGKAGTFGVRKHEQRDGGHENIHSEKSADAIGEELLKEKMRVEAVRGYPRHELPVAKNDSHNTQHKIGRFPLHNASLCHVMDGRGLD